MSFLQMRQTEDEELQQQTEAVLIFHLWNGTQIIETRKFDHFQHFFHYMQSKLDEYYHCTPVQIADADAAQRQAYGQLYNSRLMPRYTSENYYQRIYLHLAQDEVSKHPELQLQQLRISPIVQVKYYSHDRHDYDQSFIFKDDASLCRGLWDNANSKTQIERMECTSAADMDSQPVTLTDGDHPDRLRPLLDAYIQNTDKQKAIIVHIFYKYKRPSSVPNSNPLMYLKNRTSGSFSRIRQTERRMLPLQAEWVLEKQNEISTFIIDQCHTRRQQTGRSSSWREYELRIPFGKQRLQLLDYIDVYLYSPVRAIEEVNFLLKFITPDRLGVEPHVYVRAVAIDGHRDQARNFHENTAADYQPPIQRQSIQLHLNASHTAFTPKNDAVPYTNAGNGSGPGSKFQTACALMYASPPRHPPQLSNEIDLPATRRFFLANPAHMHFLFAMLAQLIQAQ